MKSKTILALFLGAVALLALSPCMMVSCSIDSSSGKPKFDAAKLEQQVVADAVAAGQGYLEGGKGGAVAALTAQEMEHLKEIAEKLKAAQGGGKNPAVDVGGGGGAGSAPARD